MMCIALPENAPAYQQPPKAHTFEPTETFLTRNGASEAIHSSKTKNLIAQESNHIW